ncbi:hypothetical protein PFICI_07333 [Pestalotiopsis fici W106-1]|uniref:Rhodopsin domain-containing protein n=1 Tax=Pestalotiopsis fici (strain W106-1 / CGMCC3.15140) TaxID=1229662 RepID=W3X1C3_PESFW|nr:uncharacterized protein PFICI_07333 [Pestalotiopsis fici W106-1]ETS79804.1 hypothetical protein PFICI_07333 [Pestalotiopsis fici W106-1]
MSSPMEMWAAARNPPADPTNLSFKGKTVLVTGANSGLGHQAAIKYAAQGEEAKAAIISATGCPPDIFIIETLDLARFASVRDFAARIEATVPELHILQLAGGIACLEFTPGPDGPALDLEVDALSPTLIALLLLPKICATAERMTAAGRDDYCYISFVNSAACLEVKRDDLPPGQSLVQRIEDRAKFEYRKQYFLIKLAAWYLMRGVANAVDSQGEVAKARVIVNASCPGMCKTNWLRGAPIFQRLMMNLTWVVFGRSAEEGARTLVGATGLGPEGHGRLWTNDKIAPLSELQDSERGTELFKETWDEAMGGILRDYLGAFQPNRFDGFVEKTQGSSITSHAKLRHRRFALHSNIFHFKRTLLPSPPNAVLPAHGTAIVALRTLLDADVQEYDQDAAPFPKWLRASTSSERPWFSICTMTHVRGGLTGRALTLETGTGPPTKTNVGLSSPISYQVLPLMTTSRRDTYSALQGDIDIFLLCAQQGVHAAYEWVTVADCLSSPSMPTLIARGGESDNLGPKIDGVCWSLTAITAIFLGVRLYVKVTQSKLWWDDYVLLVSWLLLVTAVGISTYSVALGFGRHMKDVPVDKIWELVKLTDITSALTLVGAACSKTSFALSLLRLTSGWTKATIWFIIITMSSVLCTNAILPYVRCCPSELAWNPHAHGKCFFDVQISIHFSVFAAAYSAAMDWILALIPWPIIMRLNIKTKEKIGIAICMSLGFFAGITSVVRCSTIPLLVSHDTTYFSADVMIWTAAEIATTIMAASIPVLRVFLRRMVTVRRSAGSNTNHNSYHRSAADGTFLKSIRAESEDTGCTTKCTSGARGRNSGVIEDSRRTSRDTRKITSPSAPDSRRKIVKIEEVAIRSETRSHQIGGSSRTSTGTRSQSRSSIELQDLQR